MVYDYETVRGLLKDLLVLLYMKTNERNLHQLQMLFIIVTITYS